ncbi:hypothetical protein ESY86_18575 [Subsaximicrobium wynnwilliamsii]|uniref:XRE family transcriptional regulator n=1 Tax=Subsaximicrobium wynnwilliamsii TaxID=291179 RepID=A0A5C6ZC73_9FLAO|nr:hypothetical protein [Subsaximicrobium wynnwilliamsii]TXD81179.1 hypothetical protein ESY87_19075 [Subsaximicrobium wynnwilliamsii]TXD86996.1 hypothetical protein ESY86_18575 [Subsaximicrobium wynnwilliamsii]TXE00649.1 hypothetical protein ESY88_18875 [Subsaximicrobium wynnwilliamsii]
MELNSGNIKIKIAIALNRLLTINIEYSKVEDDDLDIIKSYNKIALDADIRKATVSDAFNAKSKSGPNSTTIVLIIEAMGFSIKDFAIIYDSINKNDIENFNNSKN